MQERSCENKTYCGRRSHCEMKSDYEMKSACEKMIGIVLKTANDERQAIYLVDEAPQNGLEGFAIVGQSTFVPALIDRETPCTTSSQGSENTSNQHQLIVASS
jgi:hypothetical protein